MKKSLLKFFFFFTSITLVHQRSFSQESTPIGTDFYYNNFASATAGSISSLGVNATRLSTSTTIDAVTSSALNNTTSLASKNLAAVGSIRWNFMTTNTSLTTNDYEWEFTYRNSSTSGNDDPDAMTSGNNSWRFWLICNNSTFNSNQTQGIYVTHYGTTLAIRYRYDNTAGTGRYNTLASITLANDQQAYSIRLRRTSDGTWRIYAQLIASPYTTTTSTNGGNTGSGFNAYYYSFLESTTTADNRFQWDDVKMYTVKLLYEPVSAAANGITQLNYPGEPDVIPYGIRVKMRGDVELGRLKFASDQNVQALFSSGELYKSTDDYFSKTSDTKLMDININNDGSNQITLPTTEKYYAAATDGSTTAVIDYFMVLQARNPFYGGAPTSYSFYMSGTATDNYSAPYGNNTPPISSTPSSTAGTSFPSYGNYYDWKGVTGSYSSSGNWLYNGSATSSVPGAGDLFRIGFVAYTSSLTLTGTTTVGSVILGSSQSSAIDLAGQSLSITGVLQSTSTTSTTTISNTTGNGVLNVTTLVVNNPLNTTNAGTSLTVNVSGDYVNNKTVSFSNTSFVFNGTTQTLADLSTGTTFPNVTFQGGGTKTMSIGNFYVASTGTLTMSGTTTLATGGLLTIRSDANGSASVAALPTAATITGNVNVERYLQGSSSDLTKRGYRLMSSPVYAGTTTAGSPYTAATRYYSLGFLKTYSIVTGFNGTSNGFTSAGNASIYLFREDIIPSNTAFASGNYKGISNLNPGTAYYYGINAKATLTNASDANTYVPVGNGFLFFFRGNSTVSNGTTGGSKTTTPYNYPENTTMVQSGALNRGSITVQPWFTTATNLSYTANITNNATGSNIRGYNLIGNPYASTINWEKYNRNSTVANSSIYGSGSLSGGTIYVYNSTSKQYSSYQNNTGTVDTTSIKPGNAVSSDGVASNMIASGQAFFVIASAASQTLTFRESAKSTTQPTAANVIKLMGTPVNNNAAVDPVMRIKLIMDTVNTDAVSFVFNKTNNPKYAEDEDAIDFGGNGALLSLSTFSTDGIGLSINRLQLPKKQPEIIPLLVDATATGAYTLKLDELRNMPVIYKVWLKDNYKKDSLDLRANLTYTFNVDKGNSNTFGDKRFQIVVVRDINYHFLSLSGKKEPTGNLIKWTTENEYNYLTFTVERSGDEGKTFSAIGSVQSSGIGAYSFLDVSPAAGSYQYRIKQDNIDNDISYSDKVYITNDANTTTADINVYPNPTVSDINIAILSGKIDISKSSYTIRIVSSSGNLVKEVASQKPVWSGSMNNLQTGTYFIQVINNTDQKVIGQSKFTKI